LIKSTSADHPSSKKQLHLDIFIGSTNEKYFKVCKRQVTDELIVEFPVTDCYITTLLICKALSVIFMGTNKGSIRVSLWPICEETLE